MALFLQYISKFLTMKKSVISLLVITSLAFSCCKEDIPADLSQPVLFEYEYINYAWGYRHFGWMIDSEGKVRGYSLPEKWNGTDESMLISKVDLMENLAQTDESYTSVDNSDLLKHFNDRFDIQGARMDTSDVYMADAGIGALFVYVWDTSLNKYKKVLLASKGDLSVSNTSSKAKSAVSWLVKVGKQTDNFFWFDN